MQSREGAIFFVINIVGNFGTVFLDSKCCFRALLSRLLQLAL